MLENVVWLVSIKMLVNRNIKNSSPTEHASAPVSKISKLREPRLSVPMIILSIPEHSDFEVQEDYYKLHILVHSSK